MPTIVGILTFMSRKNSMLSWVEHGKSFITSGPGSSDLRASGYISGCCLMSAWCPVKLDEWSFWLLTNPELGITVYWDWQVWENGALLQHWTNRAESSGFAIPSVYFEPIMLQTRMGNRKNLGIIFLIFQFKDILWPLVRTVSQRRF